MSINRINLNLGHGNAECSSAKKGPAVLATLEVEGHTDSGKSVRL